MLCHACEMAKQENVGRTVFTLISVAMMPEGINGFMILLSSQENPLLSYPHSPLNINTINRIKSLGRKINFSMLLK